MPTASATTFRTISLSVITVAALPLLSISSAWAHDDNAISTEDLVQWLGSDAAAYDATVCHMSADADTDLYVFVQEKSPGAADAEPGLFPVSLWRLDSDGSHGYLGCDGRIEPDGRFVIGQWTSGVWMTPYCVCSLQRMRERFASEPLEKTTGRALVKRAKVQDCGAIDTELFRLVRQCSDENLPPLE